MLPGICSLTFAAPKTPAAILGKVDGVTAVNQGIHTAVRDCHHEEGVL